MDNWLNTIFSILSSHPYIIYPFMGFIAFIESLAFIGLIFPGVLIIGTAGFLSSHNVMEFKILVIWCSLGAIIGDITSYNIGIKYGTKITEKNFFQKYKKHYERGINFFKKYGGFSVLLGRFIGFLRPVIPFLAGMHKMEKKKFYLYVLISGILWGICYPGLGYVFGESWKKVESSIGKIILLLFIIGGFTFYKIYHKKLNRGDYENFRK